MLEVGDLFDFGFTGGLQLRDSHESQKRLLNKFETVTDYEDF